MPDAVTTRSSLRESTAGFISGAISRCIVAPLDVLKIRQQIAQGSSAPAMLAVAKDVFNTQGFAGFWRGNLPALALWASYSAVQFPAYRAAVSSLQQRGLPDSMCHAVAGASAGVSATLLTYPLDLLRTRSIAATQSSTGPTVVALVRAQLVQHSWRGLYLGLSPALLAIVPSNAVLFLVYEPLREAFAGHSGIMQHIGTALGVGSAAGAAAGIASKLATYPLDTARKRMQVHSAGDSSCARTPYTLRQCLQATFTKGGVRGLYRGLLPALLKVAVSMGPALAVYEAVRTALAGNQETRHEQ